MNKTFLAALIASISILSASTNSFAQTKNFKQATFQQTADVCFNKALLFLHNNDYFIEATDKAAGFIKAKTLTKNSKAFSAKVAERRTVSFTFVREGDKTLLLLNMYADDLKWGGSTQNRVISAEDQGIVNTPEPYKKLIDELRLVLQ